MFHWFDEKNFQLVYHDTKMNKRLMDIESMMDQPRHYSYCSYIFLMVLLYELESMLNLRWNNWWSLAFVERISYNRPSLESSMLNKDLLKMKDKTTVAVAVVELSN